MITSPLASSIVVKTLADAVGRMRHFRLVNIEPFFCLNENKLIVTNGTGEVSPFAPAPFCKSTVTWLYENLVQIDIEWLSDDLRKPRIEPARHFLYDESSKAWSFRNLEHAIPLARRRVLLDGCDSSAEPQTLTTSLDLV